MYHKKPTRRQITLKLRLRVMFDLMINEEVFEYVINKTNKGGENYGETNKGIKQH
jgi:hypothetical protein